MYFGGGSPTYYRKKEFKWLVDRIKKFVDFKNLGDFTVEIDQEELREDRLLFYHEMNETDFLLVFKILILEFKKK